MSGRILPAEAIPCRVCGYDLRAQLAAAAQAGQGSLRCPECGGDTGRTQLVDTVTFLFERHSAIVAFVLLPIDFFRLLLPRRRLAKSAPLGPGEPRRARLLLLALPIWLFSAALLFVLVSLLARVTLTVSCDGYERADPLSSQAFTALGQYTITQRCALVDIALFTSAFVVAMGALAFSLIRLAPGTLRGRTYFLRVHALRRTLLALSPVFCALVLSAAVTVLVLLFQYHAGLMVDDSTPNDVALYLILALFLVQLARAGHADGGGPGAGAYLACGGLAVMAWFVWIMALGALFTQRNLGHILRVLYLR